MGDLDFGPRPRPKRVNEFKFRELGEIQQKLLNSGLLKTTRPRGQRLFVRLCRGAAKLARHMWLI